MLCGSGGGGVGGGGGGAGAGADVCEQDEFTGCLYVCVCMYMRWL